MPIYKVNILHAWIDDAILNKGIKETIFIYDIDGTQVERIGDEPFQQPCVFQEFYDKTNFTYDASTGEQIVDIFLPKPVKANGAVLIDFVVEGITIPLKDVFKAFSVYLNGYPKEKYKIALYKPIVIPCKRRVERITLSVSNTGYNGIGDFSFLVQGQVDTGLITLR